MSHKGLTDKDLRSIVMHMTAALLNILNLHRPSEGEKFCSECNGNPCLTFTMIEQELNHLDPIIGKFNG